VADPIADPTAPRSARNLTVAGLAAVGLAAASLAGFLGGWHWLLDLASHFRPVWLVATIGLLATTAGRRRTGLTTACLAIAAAVNTGAVLPYLLPAGGDTGGGDRLELVSLNVLVDNGAKDRTLAYLRARRADVVVLLEVDAAWAGALAGLAELYPYRVVEPRDDSFGIALLSRLPLDRPRVERLAGGPPVVIAGITPAATSCLLLAAHPPAPLSAAWSADRDAQLAAIGELAAADPRPVIVAGDLNASPWSHGFRLLTAARGLRDSALGRGIRPTWNAKHPLPLVSIDHVVVSPEVRVLSRTVGPYVGSDHLPVEARLALPEQAPGSGGGTQRSSLTPAGRFAKPPGDRVF